MKANHFSKPAVCLLLSLSPLSLSQYNQSISPCSLPLFIHSPFSLFQSYFKVRPLFSLCDSVNKSLTVSLSSCVSFCLSFILFVILVFCLLFCLTVFVLLFLFLSVRHSVCSLVFLSHFVWRSFVVLYFCMLILFFLSVSLNSYLSARCLCRLLFSLSLSRSPQLSHFVWRSFCCGPMLLYACCSLSLSFYIIFSSCLSLFLFDPSVCLSSCVSLVRRSFNLSPFFLFVNSLSISLSFCLSSCFPSFCSSFFKLTSLLCLSLSLTAFQCLFPSIHHSTWRPAFLFFATFVWCFVCFSHYVLLFLFMSIRHSMCSFLRVEYVVLSLSILSFLSIPHKQTHTLPLYRDHWLCQNSTNVYTHINCLCAFSELGAGLNIYRWNCWDVSSFWSMHTWVAVYSVKNTKFISKTPSHCSCIFKCTCTNLDMNSRMIYLHV